MSYRLYKALLSAASLSVLSALAVPSAAQPSASNKGKRDTSYYVCSAKVDWVLYISEPIHNFKLKNKEESARMHDDFGAEVDRRVGRPGNASLVQCGMSRNRPIVTAA